MQQNLNLEATRCLELACKLVEQDGSQLFLELRSNLIRVSLNNKNSEEARKAFALLPMTRVKENSIEDTQFLDDLASDFFRNELYKESFQCFQLAINIEAENTEIVSSFGGS